MKTKIQKIFTSQWSALILMVFALVATGAYAATTPTLNQTINAGAKSVDIVDGAGSPVASPSAAFGALSFSFNTQDATASNIFTASQKIRVSNPTSTATWTVSIAGSAANALWTDGGNTYDFNDTAGYTDGGDTDTKGGQLTVDPSGATRVGVPDSTACPIANVTLGGSDSFTEGGVDSIDLLNGSASAPTFCRWDLTGVNLTQKIPAGQPSGSYAISMTVTII